MYSGKHNEPLYNEVLGLTNGFLYAVIVKCMRKNFYETKPFVIAYKFYQSLGPSLYQGSTVNKPSGIDHYANGDGTYGAWTP